MTTSGKPVLRAPESIVNFSCRLGQKANARVPLTGIIGQTTEICRPSSRLLLLANSGPTPLLRVRSSFFLFFLTSLLMSPSQASSFREWREGSPMFLYSYYACLVN